MYTHRVENGASLGPVSSFLIRHNEMRRVDGCCLKIAIKTLRSACALTLINVPLGNGMSSNSISSLVLPTQGTAVYYRFRLSLSASVRSLSLTLSPLPLSLSPLPFRSLSPLPFRSLSLRFRSLSPLPSFLLMKMATVNTKAVSGQSCPRQQVVGHRSEEAYVRGVCTYIYTSTPVMILVGTRISPGVRHV